MIVILGHVFQQFSGYQANIVFNIVFSIQMPLFMVISGYCNIFQKPIITFSNFVTYNKKRVVSLIIPWLVWSIISYLFIGANNYGVVEYIGVTAYHMESAYWFLFSLWTISVFYSVSAFLANKVSKDMTVLHVMVYTISFGVLISSLLLCGLKCGLTFLAIKYTIYYSVFYNIGIFIGLYRNSRYYRSTTLVRYAILAIFCMGYAWAVFRYSLIDMPDSGISILIRFICSLEISCITIELVYMLPIRNGHISRLLAGLGNESLELYVVHWIIVFIHLVDFSSINCNTVVGAIILLIYFLVVTGLSILIVKIIRKSRILSLILFGKN